MRLLHVPSMESQLRHQDTAYYSHVSIPAYNILLYTWGRFTVPDGPAILVRNIPWNVPSIDSKRHFSVSHFRQLIERIADADFIKKVENEYVGPEVSTDVQERPELSTAVPYIWLDVACIDQGTSEVSHRIRMEEIGKQVMIFGRAATAYV